MKEIIQINNSFRIVKIKKEDTVKYVPEMRSAFFFWTSFLAMKERFGFFYNKKKIQYDTCKEAENFIDTLNNQKICKHINSIH